MFWKIYFWIFSIFSIIGIIISLGQSVGLGDWISILLTIPAIIAVYTYVYKKHIFSPSFWRGFFWVMIGALVVSLLSIIYPPFNELPIIDQLQSKIILDPMQALLSVVFTLPTYYVLYKLSKLSAK